MWRFDRVQKRARFSTCCLQRYSTDVYAAWSSPGNSQRETPEFLTQLGSFGFLAPDQPSSHNHEAYIHECIISYCWPQFLCADPPFLVKKIGNPLHLQFSHTTNTTHKQLWILQRLPLKQSSPPGGTCTFSYCAAQRGACEKNPSYIISLVGVSTSPVCVWL